MPPPTSGADDDSPAAAVRQRPSRYESQKRRDWQTFTRYLGAHRPPLQLRQCSGAHVLEFLRYLDRFGKTRVHAPPCPAYGDPRPGEACQCPLRQAWGSLDALVGRLRAAFDERHGDSGGAGANPFAARAVRLYLREVRDAQARARGISYSRRKKRRPSKQQQGVAAAGAAGASASSDSKEDGGVGRARTNGDGTTALMAVPLPHVNNPPLPPPAYLTGVPFECCDYYYGSSGVLGGGGAGATSNAGAGFYLPLPFNSFG